jgi:hypothetical protein
MIIHDHFDGSANCVECGGTCKLTGEALQLTRLVRYTIEFFALGHNGWLPPQIEEPLASLVHLNWRKFRQRSLDSAKRLKGLM